MSAAKPPNGPRALDLAAPPNNSPPPLPPSDTPPPLPAANKVSFKFPKHGTNGSQSTMAQSSSSLPNALDGLVRKPPPPPPATVPPPLPSSLPPRPPEPISRPPAPPSQPPPPAEPAPLQPPPPGISIGLRQHDNIKQGPDVQTGNVFDAERASRWRPGPPPPLPAPILHSNDAEDLSPTDLHHGRRSPPRIPPPKQPPLPPFPSGSRSSHPFRDTRDDNARHFHREPERWLGPRRDSPPAPTAPTSANLPPRPPPYQGPFHPRDRFPDRRDRDYDRDRDVDRRHPRGGSPGPSRRQYASPPRASTSRRRSPSPKPHSRSRDSAPSSGARPLSPQPPPPFNDRPPSPPPQTGFEDAKPPPTSPPSTRAEDSQPPRPSVASLSSQPKDAREPLWSELPWPPEGFPCPEDWRAVHDPVLNKADNGLKGKDVVKRLRREVVSNEPVVVRDPRSHTKKKLPSRVRTEFYITEYEYDSCSVGPPPPTSVLVTGVHVLLPFPVIRRQFEKHGPINSFDPQLDKAGGGFLGILSIKYNAHDCARAAVTTEDNARLGVGADACVIRVVLDGDGSKCKAAIRALYEKRRAEKAKQEAEAKAAATTEKADRYHGSLKPHTMVWGVDIPTPSALPANREHGSEPQRSPLQQYPRTFASEGRGRGAGPQRGGRGMASNGHRPNGEMRFKQPLRSPSRSPSPVYWQRDRPDRNSLSVADVDELLSKTVHDYILLENASRSAQEEDVRKYFREFDVNQAFHDSRGWHVTFHSAATARRASIGLKTTLFTSNIVSLTVRHPPTPKPQMPKSEPPASENPLQEAQLNVERELHDVLTKDIRKMMAQCVRDVVQENHAQRSKEAPSIAALSADQPLQQQLTAEEKRKNLKGLSFKKQKRQVAEPEGDSRVVESSARKPQPSSPTRRPVTPLHERSPLPRQSSPTPRRAVHEDNDVESEDEEIVVARPRKKRRIEIDDMLESSDEDNRVEPPAPAPVAASIPTPVAAPVPAAAPATVPAPVIAQAQAPTTHSAPTTLPAPLETPAVKSEPKLVAVKESSPPPAVPELPRAQLPKKRTAEALPNDAKSRDTKRPRIVEPGNDVPVDVQVRVDAVEDDEPAGLVDSDAERKHKRSLKKGLVKKIPQGKKAVLKEDTDDTLVHTIDLEEHTTQKLAGGIAEIEPHYSEKSQSPSPLPHQSTEEGPLPDMDEYLLDDEDRYYAKLLLADKVPLETKPSLAEVPLPEPDDPDHLPFRIHDSGSARTEGYYKIPHKAKLAYVAQYSDRAITTTGVGSGEGSNAPAPAPQAAVSSRSARASGRRQAQGLDAINRLLQESQGADQTAIKFNQLQTRKKALRFARSPIHDWGLYAMERIARGEMVIEYVGELIRAPVADRREKLYEKQGIGSSYLFRIDDELVVDATKKGNLGRLINHACEPNCTAKIISVTGVKKIVIYAKIDIELGDELTYDYHFPIEEAKIVCLCGSARCRGFLN